VEGEDITEVYEKFEGSEGGTVELTVLRDEEERRFSVERVKLDAPAVTWNLIPDTDVVHLRLARFSKNSASELEKAINKARDAGARRFVLDLRDNPGGWVRQAERVAALFLPAGSPIYIQRDSEGEEEETNVPGGDDTLDAPLVILVNEGTASSAEILAGAAQRERSSEASRREDLRHRDRDRRLPFGKRFDRFTFRRRVAYTEREL
jgi:carboxyl-terminal processing protease